MYLFKLARDIDYDCLHFVRSADYVYTENNESVDFDNGFFSTDTFICNTNFYFKLEELAKMTKRTKEKIEKISKSNKKKIRRGIRRWKNRKNLINEKVEDNE